MNAIMSDSNAKWDVLLLFISAFFLFLFIAVGIVLPLTEAEAISETLAPEICADTDQVRSHLERILTQGAWRRTVFYCVPLAFISVLIAARLTLRSCFKTVDV